MNDRYNFFIIIKKLYLSFIIIKRAEINTRLPLNMYMYMAAMY